MELMIPALWAAYITWVISFNLYSITFMRKALLITFYAWGNTENFQGHELRNGGTGIQNPKLFGLQSPHVTPLLTSLRPPQLFQEMETGYLNRV